MVLRRAVVEMGKLMKVEQDRTSKRPIAVTSEFFGALQHIFDNTKEIAIKEVALAESATVEMVRSVLEGHLKPVFEANCPDDANRAEVDDFYKRRREARFIEALESRLSLLTRLSASARFASGSTFNSNSLDELKTIIENQPDKGESLSFYVGNTSGNSISLYLYDGQTTAICRIIGDQRDVQFFDSEIQALFRRVEPAHPWLYNRYLPILPIALLTTFLAYIVFSLINRFAPGLGLATVHPIVFNLATVPLMLLLLHLWERAHPRLQVEYGASWNKIKARRRVFWGVLTTLFVPIMIEVTKTLFS